MINPIAVYALYDNVVSTTGDVEETFVAFDKDGKEVAVDFSDIDAWVDPNAYKYARERAYPSLQDQLDMQYHDSVNNTTTWATAVAKVKTDNPKPA